LQLICELSTDLQIFTADYADENGFYVLIRRLQRFMEIFFGGLNLRESAKSMDQLRPA